MQVYSTIVKTLFKKKTKTKDRRRNLGQIILLKGRKEWRASI